MYKITIDSNVTLNVYLINMNSSELFPYSTVHPEELNQTYLETLLQTKPEIILQQYNITHETINYTPITNGSLMIILLNPSDDTAQIQYNYAYYHMFVPKTLSLQIAAVTIPIGLILAAPMIKENTKKITKLTSKFKRSGPDRI